MRNRHAKGRSTEVYKPIPINLEVAGEIPAGDTVIERKWFSGQDVALLFAGSSPVDHPNHPTNPLLNHFDISVFPCYERAMSDKNQEDSLSINDINFVCNYAHSRIESLKEAAIESTDNTSEELKTELQECEKDSEALSKIRDLMLEKLSSLHAGVH